MTFEREIPEGVEHGKRNTYTYWRCRCEKCRGAYRDYVREYRAYVAARRKVIEAVGELTERLSEEQG